MAVTMETMHSPGDVPAGRGTEAGHAVKGPCAPRS